MSNPCNEGTCITTTDCPENICGYACVCSNGTTGNRNTNYVYNNYELDKIGKNCEIGPDLCSSNPCMNGGNCSISSNSYVCQCIPPYSGTNCDLTINECFPNPCLNNGSCIRNSSLQTGEFICECQEDYMGTRCEYCKLYFSKIIEYILF